MKRTFYLLTLLVFFISCKEKTSTMTVDYIPHWDTIRVLENPHKGWYQHFYDNQIVKYKVKDKELFRNFPGMDHLYLRLAWSFLEPEEGKYNWKLIDDIVDEYVPEGYGISFSITSKETGEYPIVVGQQKKWNTLCNPYMGRRSRCERSSNRRRRGKILVTSMGRSDIFRETQ